MGEVFDASDIVLSVEVESELEPIAHITSATLSIDTSGERVVVPSAPLYGTDVITDVRWRISGTSLVTYSPGHSFATMKGLQMARANVSVSMSLAGETYTGDVKIRRLSAGGNTMQSATMNFTLDGQGELS